MNADESAFDMHPSDDTRTIVLSSLALKSDLPTVLIHHSPVGVQYAEAAGIDLVVSGHTHAGQLIPATLFAGWIFPFNRGLHQQGGTQVFVSQGAGTFLTRVRLGTSNEINLLRLTP
jgi:predicted MPP superfamily phosphohydrolase